MKGHFLLEQKKDRSLWFREEESSEKIEVCSVSKACRILKKSRRQIYRYIHSGLLRPIAKVLNEILLEYEAIKRLDQAPLFTQPLPSTLAILFPEYSLSFLNAGKDRRLIITRILEGGSLSQLRWLFKRYKKKDIVKIFKEEGTRLLSLKTRTLWALYFHVTLKPLWRTQNNPWPTENG